MLLGGGAVALGLLAGPAAGVPGARPAAAAPVDVRPVFLRDCAVCHGADGLGTSRGPSLIGVGRASVDYWVSTGRMPLERDTARPARSPGQRAVAGRQLPDPTAIPRRRPPAYPPAVVGALVDYVAALGPGGPDIPRPDLSAASLAQGGELFRLQCAACHAWAGDGGALLQREAPNLHQATVTQIAEAVRVGPGAMPAFGTAALDDSQLASVVAYVRYLDHPRDRGGQPLWHLGPMAEGLMAWVVGMGLLLLTVGWIGER
jgi:ubiquinol-cytochrome c reductase cytochrome c subunit